MRASRGGHAWAAPAYAAMVLGAIGLFLLVRRYGETLSAPAPAVPGRTLAAAGTEDVFFHLLIALAAVIFVGRLLGRLFTAIGQPPVIGEVVGGILLGPSLLGAIAPGAYLFILPPSVVPFLGVIAQLGVILYMFLVGLELDPGLLRGQVHATVAISHASIVAAVPAGHDAGAVSVPARLHERRAVHAASRCSSAWRCRSRRFRCWRAS